MFLHLLYNIITFLNLASRFPNFFAINWKSVVVTSFHTTCYGSSHRCHSMQLCASDQFIDGRLLDAAFTPTVGGSDRFLRSIFDGLESLVEPDPGSCGSNWDQSQPTRRPESNLSAAISHDRSTPDPQTNVSTGQICVEILGIDQNPALAEQFTIEQLELSNIDIIPKIDLMAGKITTREIQGAGDLQGIEVEQLPIDDVDAHG